MPDGTSDPSQRLDGVERRLDSHDRRIAELETDMTEIRTYLGECATKSDIASLRTYIDHAVNGILRDALNAVPARHAALWGGVVAIATIGMIAVSLWH